MLYCHQIANAGNKAYRGSLSQGTYLAALRPERPARVEGRSMSRSKLRVAVVGVGNCASSFVQGLTHYADATANEPPPGLMHVDLGGYRIGDIELAAAFDIHAGKVGRDLAEAILVEPKRPTSAVTPTDCSVLARTASSTRPFT